MAIRQHCRWLKFKTTWQTSTCCSLYVNPYTTALTFPMLLMWSHYRACPFNKARLTAPVSGRKRVKIQIIAQQHQSVSCAPAEERFRFIQLITGAYYKISSCFRDGWTMTFSASFQMLFPFNHEPCHILLSLQTFQRSSQMSAELRLVFSVCWLRWKPKRDG